MEHKITAQQLEILSEVDFLVPLKQVGLITRSVLEALELFYKPRRIIVVTPKKEADILKDISKFWDTKHLEFIHEEDFFKPNFNLSIEDITKEYDITRGSQQREPGWWIQQLIKLGAATQIDTLSPDKLSPVYIVWDGDLVPTRRWKLCDYNNNGEKKFYFAILQSESRSEFNSYQYASCMKSLTNMTPIEPEEGGTFVSHHMVFYKNRVTEMINLMIEHSGSHSIPWPKLIMFYSRKFYRFSEYKTYATFMIKNYPKEFNYHVFDKFGSGGLRFREANEIIKKILLKCPVINGGIPYEKFKLFFVENWNILPGAKKDVYPAYIQLDHVYGLD
jgi:hypothetical protein